MLFYLNLLFAGLTNSEKWQNFEIEDALMADLIWTNLNHNLALNPHKYFAHLYEFVVIEELVKTHTLTFYNVSSEAFSNLLQHSTLGHVAQCRQNKDSQIK